MWEGGSGTGLRLLPHRQGSLNLRTEMPPPPRRAGQGATARTGIRGCDRQGPGLLLHVHDERRGPDPSTARRLRVPPVPPVSKP